LKNLAFIAKILSMQTIDFIRSESPDPHIQRRKELLKAYPAQVRALMGNYPATAFFIVAAVVSQFSAAYLLRDQSIGWVVLTAFAFGAFINHALYVFIHECTHNLVFKNSLHNRFMGMFCDFALFAPGSMAFRKYHLIHHNRQGQHDFDADLVSETEARWVGNHWFKKLIWVFLMAVSQAARPNRLKIKPFWDFWIAGNLILQIAVMATAYQFVGFHGLIYLGLSTLFGLGLHPLGGRWIAEHYVIHENQETYSYYGPLNTVAFNVGYHNEHHDVMTIAWKNLPKLKQLAPEFYSDLVAHESYPMLLWRFIWDPKLHLKSRVLRKPVPVVPVHSGTPVFLEDGVSPEVV
jgi:sphingolipid delta-4 desaturase